MQIFCFSVSGAHARNETLESSRRNRLKNLQYVVPKARDCILVDPRTNGFPLFLACPVLAGLKTCSQPSLFFWYALLMLHSRRFGAFCERHPSHLVRLFLIPAVCPAATGLLGWHLSFFGGARYMQNKISTFSHQVGGLIPKTCRPINHAGTTLPPGMEPTPLYGQSFHGL